VVHSVSHQKLMDLDLRQVQYVLTSSRTSKQKMQPSLDITCEPLKKTVTHKTCITELQTA